VGSRRKLWFGLPLGALLALGCATSARSSCDDLVELANGLDDLADYYLSGGSVYEESSDDVRFGPIVDELEGLAAVEQDAQLNTAIGKMAGGYDDLDGSAFEQGLEATIFRIDQLYDRDCR